MDEQERKRRHAENEKERRRRNGAISRAEYLKQSNELSREIISLFFDHACKPTDIARRLGIGRMTVHRALSRWNDYVEEGNDTRPEHGLDTSK
jgi:DNA-directed RNA polymerase specialized sigma subunit